MTETYSQMRPAGGLAYCGPYEADTTAKFKGVLILSPNETEIKEMMRYKRSLRFKSSDDPLFTENQAEKSADGIRTSVF